MSEPSAEGMDAAERLGFPPYLGPTTHGRSREQAAREIDAAFAPVLAAKDAEIAALTAQRDKERPVLRAALNAGAKLLGQMDDDDYQALAAADCLIASWASEPSSPRMNTACDPTTGQEEKQ